MPTWIALLRGVNVGGKNKLPMKPLVSTLEAIRFRNVRTYIQSGNIVFQSTSRSAARLEKQIADAIAKEHGFSPQVLVVGDEQLRAAIESNPFSRAEADPKSLHLLFLAEIPANPDLAAIRRRQAGDESFELVDRVLYLHAPSGIARSRLAARVEHDLGVSTTARNWRTVSKLAQMAADVR